MATELLFGSDCSLSPKLSPYPSGSPIIHFSLVEEIPYLPDVKESLLYKPDILQSPKSPSRVAYLRERSTKRHIPYPSRPSPLELRFANRVTGRVREPDFTSEQLQEKFANSHMIYVQKHEDAISSGLSRMSFDTLYKVFKAVLASHEAARHEVATSLWQVEYSERMTVFNQALHEENKNHLNLRDEQLKKIRNIFSEHERTEIDDDTNYIQAVYNDECEMLRTITTQAEIISKCLGSRAKRELLASTGEVPYLPCFVGASQNRDNITYVLRGGFTDAGTDTDTDSDIDFGEEEDRRSGVETTIQRGTNEAPDCRALPSLRYLRRQARSTLKGSECSEDLEVRAEARHEKAQWVVLKSKVKLGEKMEIYALEGLVDSGWMLLDGWRYRALKHGNARMARIAQESCASYRNSCGQYTEWCCEFVLSTP
ncbi:uncharacterized protein F5891DRAFT_988107 [Suillus fuscotomentosus]|uniref:Uncharacterized protein n=1 Tax=Suillus fuscotomentosus TaxID=1912939 RepID=A0AAD4DP78_9AGAM|nr:uncharacterized protein F5891DRAFT_988107 [Suillus fuscotomentosus]KAG1887538.1 hypothetical protein F5891DRAFT_988107 [Suillus fuscotomentosus]